MSGLDWSAPFEQLESAQHFRSRGRTITESDLVAFSALTGDMHPQHTDADWAAASRFGERIAHGMLLVSYAAGLVPFDPARVLALRRLRDVVFKRPARIGDTIRVDGQIATLNPVSEDAGLVGLRWNIRDSGKLLLCRADVDVLWSAGATPRPAERQTHLVDALDLPPGVIPC
jgi:3-hydroxybutyryl-CoA dehydratase